MRITTNFKSTYLLFIGIEIFLSIFVLIAVLDPQSTDGSPLLTILFLGFMMLVVGLIPKAIVRHNHATITIRDGYLEYRQGNFEPELHLISDLKMAHKMEIYTEETEITDRGTKKTMNVESFLLLVETDDEAFKVPTNYFKEEDIDIVLRELVKENDYIDVNNYDKKRIRNNQANDLPLVNKLLETIKNRENDR